MIPRPIRAAFKKSWLKGLVAIVILVVGELLKDRIANWANLAIDSESGAVLEYIAPIIKEMAIAPLGYTVAAAVIVIIVIFVHAYLKEYSLKKKTSDIADTQEYMPLPEAARLVYEGLRKVDKGHPQVIMAESGPSVLDFFAIAISLETDVYGEHPPSTMLELLDSDELNKYGQFDDHGNTFKYYGEEEAKYIHLAIKKASLNKIIETLLAGKAEPYSKAVAWIPAREAITYVMKWLSNHGSSLTDGDLMIEAMRQIRQAALDGEIQLRGNREANRDMGFLEQFSDVQTMIPNNYWEHMMLHPVCVDENCPHEPHTAVENSKYAIPNYESIPKYFHVHINQSDLLKKWG